MLHPGTEIDNALWLSGSAFTMSELENNNAIHLQPSQCTPVLLVPSCIFQGLGSRLFLLLYSSL